MMNPAGAEVQIFGCVSLWLAALVSSVYLFPASPCTRTTLRPSMAKRESKRLASQKAVYRIRASFLKSNPRGMVVPKMNSTKRSAEAAKTESRATHNASKAKEAGMLISAIRYANGLI